MSEMSLASPRIVIGIPTRQVRLAGRDQPFHGAFEAYIDALQGAGAGVLLLPSADGLSAASRCDGLLLVGGEDLGEADWWTGGGGPLDADPDRDAAESQLVVHARARRIPTLGICRGMQLVNCVLGGRIAAAHAESLAIHMSSAGGPDVEHPVTIAGKSRLAALFSGADAMTVVSRHRIKLASLGSGLRAIAWSVDGTIEAIEADDWPFLGVQWHPEMTTNLGGLSPSLFQWLARTAQEKVEGS